MHHFRGVLFRDGRAVLDPADVYVQYHTTEGGRGQGWYGYLLVAPEADVGPGGSYTLKLSDGRSGGLRVEAVTPDDSGKFRATFFGEGPLG